MLREFNNFESNNDMSLLTLWNLDSIILAMSDVHNLFLSLEKRKLNLPVVTRKLKMFIM